MSLIESTEETAGIDRQVREVYDLLRSALSQTGLAPSTEANLKDALASVSIVVAAHGIEYEYLIDEGI